MRMLLKQEEVKSIKYQAKLQELEFQSQKRIAQLELKVAQLLHVKSEKIGGNTNQINSMIQMKFSNVDDDEDGDMDDHAQDQDANLDVIDQLDQKIQEVERDNQDLRDKNSLMIR